MAQAIEKKLLYAIRKDDVEKFESLMKVAQCGKFRLGRFPVLSLMYLYSSRKILANYEDKFLKITEWIELSEPAGVVYKFSKQAGKCLRLYFDNVVSPIEMLLILDKTKHVEKIYPRVLPSDPVKERLKSIYYIKYSLGVKFEKNAVILDRRPLNYGEKKKIFIAAISCVLALLLIIGVPSSVASYVKAHAGDITALGQIDFSSQKTYTLKSDITIPDNYSVRRMNCSIVGNGHKLILGKRSTLGEFGGKLRNVEIETAGSPIFSVCTKSAVLKDITVNVYADVTTEVDTAFVAVTNYGTIDGVTLNVSGKAYAYGEEKSDEDGEPISGVLSFGGILSRNGDGYNPVGTVKNCSVNFLDFSLEGVKHANASFGGIAGINFATLSDCTVSGDVSSDTFDLGGACYANAGTMSRISSSVNLTQVSSDEGWYPTVGGIVIQNESNVAYCINTGSITVIGGDETFVGGIAGTNYGRIYFCAGRGNISVTAPTASVGGVYGESRAMAVANNLYLGVADYCVSDSRISVSLESSSAHIGGIAGLVEQELFHITYVDGWDIVTQDLYMGGGVTNSVFLGSLDDKARYTGNIAGVCSENIYSSNSYILNGTSYMNFAGNYYPSGAVALGALLSSTGTYLPVEKEKGATSLSISEIKATETYKLIAKTIAI